MLAISEELDQSSRMAGASWLTTHAADHDTAVETWYFRRLILLFVIFLRELSISIMSVLTATRRFRSASIICRTSRTSR